MDNHLEHLEPLPRLHAVAGGAIVGLAISALPTIILTIFVTSLDVPLIVVPELNSTFVVCSAVAGALLGIPLVAVMERLLDRLTSRVLSSERADR